MNWTLEVVVVPVADIDRAKAFYSDQLGFNVDHDISPPGPGNRLVQLTPPGSGCSVLIGEGVVPHMPPCRTASASPPVTSEGAAYRRGGAQAAVRPLPRPPRHQGRHAGGQGQAPR